MTVTCARCGQPLPSDHERIENRVVDMTLTGALTILPGRIEWRCPQ